MMFACIMVAIWVSTTATAEVGPLFAITVPINTSAPTHILSLDPLTGNVTDLFAFTDVPFFPQSQFPTTYDAKGTIYMTVWNPDVSPYWLGVAWYNPYTKESGVCQTPELYVYNMGVINMGAMDGQLYVVATYYNGSTVIGTLDRKTCALSVTIPYFPAGLDFAGEGTFDTDAGVWYGQCFDTASDWWMVAVDLASGDVRLFPLGLYQADELNYDPLRKVVVGWFLREKEHNVGPNSTFFPGTFKYTEKDPIALAGNGYPISQFGIQPGGGTFNPITSTNVDLVLDKVAGCWRLMSINPYTGTVLASPNFNIVLQTWEQGPMVFAYAPAPAAPPKH